MEIFFMQRWVRWQTLRFSTSCCKSKMVWSIKTTRRVVQQDVMKTWYFWRFWWRELSLRTFFFCKIWVLKRPLRHIIQKTQLSGFEKVKFLPFGSGCRYCKKERSKVRTTHVLDGTHAQREFHGAFCRSLRPVFSTLVFFRFFITWLHAFGHLHLHKVVKDKN